MTNLIGREVIFNGETGKVTDQPEAEPDMVRVEIEARSRWLRTKDVDILPKGE